MAEPTPEPWVLERNEDGHVILMGPASALPPSLRQPQHVVTYDHYLLEDPELATAREKAQFAEAEANLRLMGSASKLLAACKAVEEWWLREGMHAGSYGAPSCIFMVREAIELARTAPIVDRVDT